MTVTQTPQHTYQPPPPLSPSDQRLWATLVHVGGLFFGILPSLIGYLVLKDRGDFIRDHTRNALNFHITYLIAAVFCGILVLIFIGALLLLVLYVLAIIFSIRAAVAAYNGQYYKYPLAIEFVK